MITAIVAYNKNFVIGNNQGSIPWHIPDDLNFFKETTMGHTCIMGRKTWESIPSKYRPLPGRYNIIISRTSEVLQFTPAEAASGKIWIMPSVEGAIHLAKTIFSKDVFITGGSQIYQYCIEHNLIDRVLASEIHNHLDIEGSAVFPDLKNLGWTGEVIKEFAEFNVVEYKKP